MSAARGDDRRRPRRRGAPLHPCLLAGRARARAFRSMAGPRRGRRRSSPPRASTGRSCARPRSTARATARRSNCSRWRRRGLVAAAARGPPVGDPCRGSCRLMLALAEQPDADPPDRARRRPPGRLDHRHFARTLGRAFGRARRTVSIAALSCSGSPPGSTGWSAATRPSSRPTARLFLPSRLERRARRAPPAGAVAARIDTGTGLDATARWYRGAGLAVIGALLRPNRLLMRTPGI